MSTFASPGSATSGLQGYDLEGASGSKRKKRRRLADYKNGIKAAAKAVADLTSANSAIQKGAGVSPAFHHEDITMNDLSLFVQLRKVDAKQRIVYGTAIAEVADRANEIFDYKTSKPEFEKWSSEVEKSSGGKSLGNVRSMHGKVAAGKLTDILFDDKNKSIDVAAKIVDDEEWKKVEEGVYTGFSIGGRYLKRWQDGDLKRYTAGPSEISLVDLPCVPTATFSLVKADGSEELRKFVEKPAEKVEDKVEKTEVVDNHPEFVTNNMIAQRATEIAKSNGGQWSDYMDTARAQLDREVSAYQINKRAAELEIKKAAEKAKADAEAAALAKAAETVEVKVDEAKAAEDLAKTEQAAASPRSSGDGEWDQVWVSKRLPGQTFAKKSELMQAIVELDAQESATQKGAPLLEAVDQLVAKTEVKDGGETQVVTEAVEETKEEVEKREFSAGERKKDAKSGAAESDGSYPIENASDLHNAIQAYGRSKNKAATKRHIIARARSLGLTDKLPDGWGVKKLVENANLNKAASLYGMSDLMNMLACVECLEERAEGDAGDYGFGVSLSKEITDRFGSALIALGDVVADVLDAVLQGIRDEERDEALNRAIPLAGLLKLGARHSMTDKSLIKTVHDAAVSLDKACCGTMEAAARDEMAKAASDAEALVAKNEELQAKLDAQEVAFSKLVADATEKLTKRITMLEKQPAAVPPGSFRIVDKTIDTSREVAKADAVDEDELRKRARMAQMARTFGPAR